MSIRHLDPNKVVPFFDTVLILGTKYIALSIQKYISENTSILVVSSDQTSMHIDLSKLHDYKQENQIIFAELLTKMYDLISTGKSIEVVQPDSYSPPDITTTIYTHAGLNNFLTLHQLK